MASILIVEDEEKIARFVELELIHEGYQTGKAADGRTGLFMAESGEYDLMVLDIMLPVLNGLEVLRRLRKTSDMPVILLTARDAVMDKVSGLEMGADDYMTKPFAIEELLARIRLALRKASKGRAVQPCTVLTAGEVSLNVEAHTVVCRGEQISLTGREFSLLQTLLENKNIVMSRDSLTNRVWGYDYFGETNVVDVYVRYLRQKIDDVYKIQLIQTVRGVGYVIKDNG
ncbi:MAG: response regulator transcription factor [Lachnospiraceae bacterium]|nr:response regulator transcription factor [Lachnospiraceae bacterium]